MFTGVHDTHTLMSAIGHEMYKNLNNNDDNALITHVGDICRKIRGVFFLGGGGVPPGSRAHHTGL